MKLFRLFHPSSIRIPQLYHGASPRALLPSYKMAHSRSFSAQSIKLSDSFEHNAAGSRKAYIALGSNLGDRIGMLEKALLEMTARGIKIKRTSSLWETKPMYVLDQDNFVNGACEVSTFIPLFAFLIKKIFSSQGYVNVVS